MKLNTHTLLAVAFLPASTWAEYKLTKDYSSFAFIGGFDYYNGPDPTNGHVQYKGYATANATGLTGFVVGPNGTNIGNATLPPPIYLGVDFTNTYPVDVGRPSVRVSSVKTYNHSLVIADILHMPSSTCGLWPSFWMLGTSAQWPKAGEIDIVENVNDNDFNIMTLHTNARLSVSNKTALFNGTLRTANCDIDAPNQGKNEGCSIRDSPSVQSYGTGFNKNGGGVFAMQYTSDHIAIWFFPRGAIPGDILSNKPMPPSLNGTSSSSSWGKPNALFQPAVTSPVPAPSSLSSSTSETHNVIVPVTLSSTSTSTTATPAASFKPMPLSSSPSLLTSHFSSLQLVFTTTFCGDWAGRTWNTTSCGRLAPTCEEYVSLNPGAFADAFWAIQSVKVFEEATKGEAASTSTSTSTSSTSTSTTPTVMMMSTTHTSSAGQTVSKTDDDYDHHHGRHRGLKREEEEDKEEEDAATWPLSKRTGFGLDGLRSYSVRKILPMKEVV